MPVKPLSHAQLLRATHPERHGRRVFDDAYRTRRNDAVNHPLEAQAERIRRSTRWRRVRTIVLAAEPLCRDCSIYGVVTLAVDVDHVTPLVELIAGGEPELAYTRSNLQPLCRPCHNRKTAAERRTTRVIHSSDATIQSKGRS
jgi:5-methylcytosine-specific restriction endonuclease McrA